MDYKIKKVAVIGAGVMGSGIAAHLANVGIPSYLLDIVPKELTEEETRRGLALDDPLVRNRFAIRGKEQLLKSKPALLYVPENADLITPGNVEDHFNVLSEVDWIIEVVVENLAVKQQLFEKIEQVWKPGILVSSNTSGVSINRMSEGRSSEFRQHFLGTHFFNPVRYMKLLEVIPCSETKPELVNFMVDFGQRVLGKGVVVCKDTVNFIANRIGTYGLMVTVQEMVKNGLSIDDIDAITGPAMGRPKSATFRTLDIVGLDTFVHVANNVYDNVTDPQEKETFVVPQFMKEMVQRGWLGEKTKQGFYKKEGKDILVLDYNTLEYRPKEKPKFSSLETAKMQGSTRDKLRSLVYGQDAASLFAWGVLKRVLLYTAERVEEIAGDIVSIDNAMKWGFNWQQGPFETWDAIGLEKSVSRMKEEGEAIPAWVEEMIASGRTSFYAKDSGVKSFYTMKGEYKGIEQKKEIIDLKALKEQGKVIKSNSGASLIDIGDGIACLEFHSPNQAIGTDITMMINQACDEVSQNWRGLVIGNQAKNFCVGANLMMLLMEIQDENWDDVNWTVKQFQDTLMKLKYLDKPVVAAPHTMTLGGGIEVCFPADRIQAAAESYIGLVEVGVGLLPGGGGNKELLIRNIEAVQDQKDVDLQPFVNKTFETIAMAKVSTSGPEAKKLGHLRREDGITVNNDYLIHDAKQVALALADAGYKAPRKKKIRVVGEPGYAVMKLGAWTMRESGYISDHDLKIADKIAFVLAGGRVPANTWVTEEYLLDLEREAFLSLCGEPKSQERMQYMLSKGKPLRN
ncbi:3-hydroxyacyl-CoA dehydrogenase/enoyl-CoA hydratase family protein [Effusibacillus lacus]|uniref:3-hydroxyacyl-CoA dehydrogenase n=1 Tax=Effusibacillus lacus TaxID=1348429 RepID=A0A292YC73_9BACL|nr:3-hydroxyacyl-CoA dehydrogenase/enoyl-CoA hydratase family protein [Effusibacillus lacus]TCS68581.1 3-hydroxyacyl-CoA dehydrogenase [Effusibacillus lacus]GAX88832.1 3-hydroxyacyl-CoA dehydrogenase [Effusibacillus lacus]